MKISILLPLEHTAGKYAQKLGIFVKILQTEAEGILGKELK
jgi:hypothetical protein